MDLTPRTGDVADGSPAGSAPKRRSRKNLGAGAVLAVVLGLGAVFLWQGLSNATMYFCNADEVGARAECTGDQRFRLQGMVETGSVTKVGEQYDFAVSYGGRTIEVRHQGEPGGIFREGIPVVAEGRMEGDVFVSDRILVKHTEQYREDNPDRVPVDAP